ncbi:putative serine/threonine protein phosphatase type 5 [Trypanosoma grayi]|uniref:putative serine/threonine protein phosphatase type 5 n=1 Tax=Trypanosoma grayi TaxID=71804 RepID=UPI0004F4B41E|nr:putative serine/threonine protein phosphatase type 5 [Trypanosoma grayi]KEG13806.1 putative serine/threonine protein phosphatase type 5 [Trypanosoma grayi]
MLCWKAVLFCTEVLKVLNVFSLLGKNSDAMLSDVEKTMVTVPVDGDIVSQEVYVDVSTGLDVDPHSGVFRPRAETEELIREVYRVGRDALPKELERFNKWMKTTSQSGVGGLLLQPASPVLTKVGQSGDAAKSVEDKVDWRTRGNESMRCGDARKAAHCYREALRREPSKSALWSNRAAAMIQLGRGDAALADAEQAITLDPTNVKAYYRKASALCLLGAREAAGHVVRDCVERFGVNEGWMLLGKRIQSAEGVMLACDRWICTESFAEGEELCALEAVRLPSANVLEVLRLWARSGVPREVLAKEAAYYEARGSVPSFLPYDGVVALQKLCIKLAALDQVIPTSDSVSADILRWCCLLLDAGAAEAAGGPWMEFVFGDGCVFLGAALFRCGTAQEGNVILRFDEAAQLLRVAARRRIERYDTLCSFGEVLR